MLLPTSLTLPAKEEGGEGSARHQVLPPPVYDLVMPCGTARIGTGAPTRCGLGNVEATAGIFAEVGGGETEGVSGSVPQSE